MERNSPRLYGAASWGARIPNFVNYPNWRNYLVCVLLLHPNSGSYEAGAATVAKEVSFSSLWSVGAILCFIYFSSRLLLWPSSIIPVIMIMITMVIWTGLIICTVIADIIITITFITTVIIIIINHIIIISFPSASRVFFIMITIPDISNNHDCYNHYYTFTITLIVIITVHSLLPLQ